MSPAWGSDQVLHTEAGAARQWLDGECTTRWTRRAQPATIPQVPIDALFVASKLAGMTTQSILVLGAGELGTAVLRGLPSGGTGTRA